MIEAVIAQVLERCSPSTGDDLLGFEIDADHALSGSHLFSEAEVTRTGDPHCLLDLGGILSPKASSLGHVQDAVREIWKQVRYAEFEATAWSLTSEAAILRFVTVGANGQLCVTGRICVRGSHYARLHRKGR